MTIPHLIHQAWIPAAREMPVIPAKTLGNTMQWACCYPEFKHRLWSLDGILDLVKDLRALSIRPDDIQRAILQCRFPSMQADVGRLIILYALGGFWVDLKIVPRTRFLLELTDSDLVVVEHPPTRQFSDPAKAKLLSNGFIGCRPELNVIGECIRSAVANILDRRMGSVWEISGPRVLMNSIYSIYGDIFVSAKPAICRLVHDQFWDKNVGWGWSDYQQSDMHWSERQKNEAMYEHEVRGLD